METEPQDVDLGGEPTGDDDPLAGVDAESEFDGSGEETLPEGVEQGTLGGDNPSSAESPDPLAEPESEFLEDPDEQEAPVPDEPEQPAAEEQPAPPVEEQPEPAPPAPPPPAEEPEGTPEPPPESPPEVPEEPTPPPAPEPATEAAGSGSPKEEEAPKPKPKRRGRPKGSGKGKSRKGKGEDVRSYVPFEKAGERYSNEQLAKLAADGKLFIVHDEIESRSGQGAIRKAYHDLSEGQESSFEIAAVPAKLWNVKTVSGRKLDQMAISVQ